MTRLGALLATTAPLLAWTAIALPADAVAARGASSARAGAGPPAVTARSTPTQRARVRSARERRAARDCRRGAAAQARKRNCGAAPARTPARRTRATAMRKKRIAVEGAAHGQAVTIAKVLATPCQNSQLIPQPSNLPLIRAAVLCLINTTRAQNGEDPLNANSQLEQAAAGHGQEMISRNYFEHVSPSGLTPVGRVRTTGYIPDSEAGYVIGENLAWGTYTLVTPQAIVSAWLASPEHLANILEARYQDTGIDIEPELPASLAEGAPGALYTQEFGEVVR